MDMYTCERQAGCQAAFASKLGSHISGSGYIRERQVGCQAAKLGSYIDRYIARTKKKGDRSRPKCLACSCTGKT